MDKNIEYLKQFVLFSQLEEKQLKEVDKLMNTKSFPEDYTIFFEGDKGENIYFLKKGKVKILKATASGKEQILEIIKPGNVFGEVVLFGFDEYPATTRTVNHVTVDILSRKKFKKHFNQNPDIAWGMLNVMAKKLYKSQHRIKNLGLRDTRGRVTSFIIDMAKEAKGNSFKNVPINISQQEIADYIGASRETVSRALNSLRKINLIDIKRNKLLVYDLDKLKSYLENK